MDNESWLPEVRSIGASQANLRRLLDDLRSPGGGVIPFVGAGLSIPVGFPGWTAFLLLMARDAGIEREIQRRLGQGEYEEAAENLHGKYAERAFEDHIEDAFADHNLIEARLPDAAIGTLPRIFRGPVITTNFDHALETAYERSGRRFDDVVWAGRSGIAITAVRHGQPVLVKLHGDWKDRDGRVLTRRQYWDHYGPDWPHVDPSLPLPRLLRLILTARSLVFLGCSLGQDRTIALLREVAREIPEIHHYAVVESPSRPDELAERARFLSECAIRPIWYPPGEHGYLRHILQHLAADLGERSGKRRPSPAAPRPAPGGEHGRGSEIIDCTAEVQSHQDFVGRYWLRTRLQAFAARHPAGYLAIIGAPGVGKSAFVARQVRSDPGAVFHFIRRLSGWDHPTSILRSLTEQLRRKYRFDEREGAYQPDPDRPAGALIESELRAARESFLGALHRVGERLEPDQRELIYLDGLDEAFGQRGHFAHVPLEQFLPASLPRGIILVVTCRADPHLLRRLEDLAPADPIRMEVSDNEEDIRAYLRAEAGRRGLSLDEDFIARLLEASDGVFAVAVRYLLPRPQLAGELSAWRKDPAMIPHGVGGWLATRWAQLGATADRRGIERDAVRAVLGLLAVAREPLSMDHFRAFLPPGAAPAGIGDLTDGVLAQRVEPVLDLAGEFLDSRGAGRATAARHRFFHTGFAEFVADQLTERERQACHRLLARGCEAVIAQKDAEPEAQEYAARHRLAHLIAAAEWKLVAEAVARAEAATVAGSLYGLVPTVRVTLLEELLGELGAGLSPRRMLGLAAPSAWKRLKAQIEGVWNVLVFILGGGDMALGDRERILRAGATILGHPFIAALRPILVLWAGHRLSRVYREKGPWPCNYLEMHLSLQPQYQDAIGKIAELFCDDDRAVVDEPGLLELCQTENALISWYLYTFLGLHGQRHDRTPALLACLERMFREGDRLASNIAQKVVWILAEFSSVDRAMIEPLLDRYSREYLLAHGGWITYRHQCQYDRVVADYVAGRLPRGRRRTYWARYEGGALTLRYDNTVLFIYGHYLAQRRPAALVRFVTDLLESERWRGDDEFLAYCIEVMGQIGSVSAPDAVLQALQHVIAHLVDYERAVRFQGGTVQMVSVVIDALATINRTFPSHVQRFLQHLPVKHGAPLREATHRERGGKVDYLESHYGEAIYQRFLAAPNAQRAFGLGIRRSVGARTVGQVFRGFLIEFDRVAREAVASGE